MGVVRVRIRECRRVGAAVVAGEVMRKAAILQSGLIGADDFPAGGARNKARHSAAKGFRFFGFGTAR